MRKIVFAIVLVFLFSCYSGYNSDTEQAAQTENLMSEVNREIGMPNIINFHEKKMLKMLYELRDKSDLICHAYLFNEIEGKIGQYLGKCIGFGLPFSVQYSNPEVYKRIKPIGGTSNISWDDVILPQAEPNGLFMPDTLSATWLMLINPETGKPEPIYIEPLIVVSPFPLH